MGGTAALVAAVAVCYGCSGDDTIMIELDEVNGSGITGVVELREAGATTRMTVTSVEGGTITGARVMPHSTCPEIDDKHLITPPTGTIQVPFDTAATAGMTLVPPSSGTAATSPAAQREHGRHETFPNAGPGSTRLVCDRAGRGS